MREFKQVILISNSVVIYRPTMVHVMYLDVDAMTDVDRALWARFEEQHHGRGWWCDDDVIGHDGAVTDIAAWLGVVSAETLAACFIAPAPGEHQVTPPPGTITGVYNVNVTSMVDDWGDVVDEGVLSF